MASKVRAHIETDWERDQIKAAIFRDTYPGRREVLQWPATPSVRVSDPDAGVAPNDDSDWLRLREDDARALYEALAEHFGHSGHDTRALRRDYDAERQRVDRLIDHITKR